MMTDKKPQWKDYSREDDIPLSSQAVIVFNEELQETGFAYMTDDYEWHDIYGDLAARNLIDWWIEMPE